MSRVKRPLKTKLMLLLGDNYSGPINLTVYPHHMPEELTSFKMDEALRFPQNMRTRIPRKIFWVEGQRFLVDSKTYGSQKVQSGDILVLTDIPDESMLSALVQAVLNVKNISTDREYKSSGPELVMRGILKGIPWIGPFLDAIFTITRKDRME